MARRALIDDVNPQIFDLRSEANEMSARGDRCVASQVARSIFDAPLVREANERTTSWIIRREANERSERADNKLDKPGAPSRNFKLFRMRV